MIEYCGQGAIGIGTEETTCIFRPVQVGMAHQLAAIGEVVSADETQMMFAGVMFF